MASENEIVSWVVSADQLGPAAKVAETLSELADLSEKVSLEFEFLVVVSYADEQLREAMRSQGATYPTQLVVIGEGNSWDQAMFAGLSRANGDYAYLFSSSQVSMADAFPKMLALASKNEVDVVGLRKKISTFERLKFLKTEVLYFLLRHRTSVPLALSNCPELLIKRRAINWVIRDLSSAQSAIEIFLIPGLAFAFVAVDRSQVSIRLSRDLRSRLITRYTNVPLRILRLCFSMTALVMLGASVNAISVRSRGLNIFNHADQQIPGWTTMVILLSFGFSVTIYSLYLVLRTILHLADQYSTKPSYVIKSVQRP